MEETKICPKSTCKYNGIAQSIIEFTHKKIKNKLNKYCRSCYSGNKDKINIEPKLCKFFKSSCIVGNKLQNPDQFISADGKNITDECLTCRKNRVKKDKNKETFVIPIYPKEFALANNYLICNYAGCIYKKNYQPPENFINKQTNEKTKNCQSCRDNKRESNEKRIKKNIELGNEETLIITAQRKEKKRAKNLKQTIEELEKDVLIGYRICHHRDCKFRVKPIIEFIDKIGVMRDCCYRCRRKRDKAEVNRSKNKIKIAQKWTLRQRSLKKLIEILKKNIKEDEKVCEHRDCKLRVQHKDNFIDEHNKPTVNCISCRHNQRIYSKLSHQRARADLIKREWINQQQRIRRLSDPEQYGEYNRRRRINPTNKIKDYIAKCEKGDKPEGVEFNLLFEDAEEYCLSDCYYCGYYPENKQQINGIDRVDNKESYYPDNCVPCCKDCNFMKGISQIDIFIKRCKHLAYKFNLEIENAQSNVSDIFYDDKKVEKEFNKLSISRLYSSYKYRAKKRNIKFELTKNTFNNILKLDCTYCGYSKFNNHNNMTIDRINSNDAYTLNNCVPACSCCNYMKHKIDLNMFKTKITNIVIRHGANY